MHPFLRVRVFSAKVNGDFTFSVASATFHTVVALSDLDMLVRLHVQAPRNSGKYTGSSKQESKSKEKCIIM